MIARMWYIQFPERSVDSDIYVKPVSIFVTGLANIRETSETEKCQVVFMLTLEETEGILWSGGMLFLSIRKSTGKGER